MTPTEKEESEVMLPDLEAIAREQDRTWTDRLLDLLVERASVTEDRRSIAETIATLADPRSEARLVALLHDRRRPDALRGAVGWVLRRLDWVEECSARHAFEEGDDILREHALLTMDTTDADIVEAIATDPSHPLHRASIEAMMFGFDAPGFQRLKVAALGHPDPTVREAAADTLTWDEPVVAEDALLEAAHDAVPAVAVSALNALRYYRTTRSLQVMGELRRAEGDVGEAAAAGFDDIREDVARTLVRSDSVSIRVRAWASPVWECLAFAPHELEPVKRSPREKYEPRTEALDVHGLLTLIADPDGEWADKLDRLRRVDPCPASQCDRSTLLDAMLHHDDPAVREQAARFCGAWDEHAALLEMMSDRNFGVRKMAMYYLKQTTRNSKVAAVALEHLRDPHVNSTHAYETLNTYVAHAPTEDAITLCERLVREDSRESVRFKSVYRLRDLRAQESITRLLDLLQRPPLVTWGVHEALLDVSHEFCIDPGDVRWLVSVDNLGVQEAVAPFAL